MKDLLYISIILVLAVALHYTYREKQHSADSFQEAIDERDAQIKSFKNENGKVAYYKRAAELAHGDLKKLYPNLYKSIKADLDVQAKDLKAYIQNEFSASGSGKASITNNYYSSDSGQTKKVGNLAISDGWLTLKATIIDSLNVPYSYVYTDTIKQSISVKRNWLFGKERLFGSAVLSNPNSKITNSKNILMTDYKDKRIGIGVGALYFPGTNEIRIGLGIQYNLIKF